ncbi:FMN-dependent NADH-azoreductase [Sphingomonas sp. ASV193]|uniref:FMN-dependent NADH-azoreductase n=1 Tax=Sphingomonas sp. ASV193 TaxID=3144405 RepID=UPI0032E8A43E
MTILHIDSSITGDDSVSRKLTAATVERLLAADPSATIVRRDLAAEPLDHISLAAFADTSVVDEFLAADTVVIGAPMYNFSVPSQLKAWIDRVSVAGKTFRYTDSGPEGLAKGKRVIIAVSRGGFYAIEHAWEHVESYLTGLFNFFGIEPEFVHADGVNYGPEQREAGIEKGLAEVEALAA